MMYWDMGPTTPSSPFPRMPDMGSPLLTSGCHHWRPVQTCSLEDLPPPVLTSSGGHRNTYGWQAGGLYPTGMQSCFLCVQRFLL